MCVERKRKREKETRDAIHEQHDPEEGERSRRKNCVLTELGESTEEGNRQK